MLADIRQQLGEQLKSLDFRLENHVSMLNELQDFYKKRSEVELEYSRNMDKLVKQIMTRHNDKQKFVKSIHLLFHLLHNHYLLDFLFLRHSFAA